MTLSNSNEAGRDDHAEEMVDVLVVGMGPVGKMAALLLGRAGRSVLVTERKEKTYPLPRAVAHDAEIARLLQYAGLPPDAMPDAVEPYDDLYVWVNGDRQTLHLVDWTGIDPSGWNNTYFYHQPALEEHLDELLHGQPTVQIERGVYTRIVQQDDDGVEVTLTREATGQQRRRRARYVLAADGAGSATRQGLGVDWHDLGYFYDWLVVDVLPAPGLELTTLALQICDPARPTTVVPGGPGRRRWEFMRLPGETVEELIDPERIWQLLAPFGVLPSNSTVDRGVVYTFNSGWATEWRRDRVFLLGDAAHQMPPFAGQGLAAGFRDCLNLTWKLGLVLDGVAHESLLHTYATERAAHVADVIDFSMSLGSIICILDPEKARARDEQMLAALAGGHQPEPPPEPRLGPGLHTGPTGGYLSWQGRVTTADRPEPTRYDDIFGVATLVLSNTSLASELEAEALQRLARAGISVTTFGTDAPSAGVRSFTDVEGTYARWLTGLDARAVLVRPDFSVYGSAVDAGGVAALVAGFLTGVEHGVAVDPAATPAVAQLDQIQPAMTRPTTSVT